MSFCAPIVSPDLTIAAICFFWSSVNDTPTRCKAVTPLIGSFSALPSWIAEVDASWPNAWDMSARIFVDWSKMSLPLPVLFGCS
jgi:hypothetical protein